MKRSLICYHGGWFAETAWLQRLLGESIGSCQLDLEQRRVEENAIVLCADPLCLKPEILRHLNETPGVVLFHVSDEWYRSPVGIYANFSHVIRSYRHSALVRPAITQIPLGPCRDVRGFDPGRPVQDRRHIWSFAGQITATRAAMLKSLAGVQPHSLCTTAGVQAAQPMLDPVAYRNLLHESVFVPCPMGNVNLESFRLYEALDAGAIPIVERRPWLDYYTQLFGPHPLPAVTSWGQAVGIMQALLSDETVLQAKRAEISSWWQMTQARLSCELHEALNGTENSLARPLRSAGLPGRLRGLCESLQHHNRVALGARLALMARRRFVRN
jgi:hypothetical protein